MQAFTDQLERIIPWALNSILLTFPYWKHSMLSLSYNCFESTVQPPAPDICWKYYCFETFQGAQSIEFRNLMKRYFRIQVMYYSIREMIIKTNGIEARNRQIVGVVSRPLKKLFNLLIEECQTTSVSVLRTTGSSPGRKGASRIASEFRWRSTKPMKIPWPSVRLLPDG